MSRELLRDFVTLFVVVNPIGLVPLFIACAGRESTAHQRRLALQAVIISACILLVFIIVGQPALGALGIELASFQLAGGLILLIIALRMVLQEVRGVTFERSPDMGNIAVFPLAMPFIAGPATLMAVVLLTDDNVYTVGHQILTTLTLFAVLVFTYFCMIGAEFVQRLLGDTGTNVVSRVMGLILAALAVQSMAGAMHQIVAPR